LYRALPTFDYTKEAPVTLLDGRTAQVRGNPEFYDRLERFVLAQSRLDHTTPLPDCHSACRLARPMFWFANNEHIVQPYQDMADGTPLWVFDANKYEAAHSRVPDAFCAYAPYLTTHLRRALSEQNL
jgi:hypothetical protein